MPLDKSIPIALANETMHSVSGGIACVVQTLNGLARRGYDARCYVLSADTSHDWMHCEFPILPWADAREFDGVMLSTYSPVCQAVASLQHARLKMFWVHSYEPYFPFVSPKPAGWAEMAHEALRLPLVKFATASWVRAMVRYAYQEECLTTLVPGGVDTTVFKPRERQNDPPVIAFLSRAEPFRGTQDIVQALGIVRSHGHAFRAWAMGSPVPGAEHVPHMAQSDYAVRLAGADIFVHGSHFEGLPLPPLEAMACGCAVVATYPGAAEYLVDGLNACVIPPQRPDIMASRIEYLLTRARERQQLGASGRAMVALSWTWDHTVGRLLEAVDEATEHTMRASA